MLNINEIFIPKTEKDIIEVCLAFYLSGGKKKGSNFLKSSFVVHRASFILLSGNKKCWHDVLNCGADKTEITCSMGAHHSTSITVQWKYKAWPFGCRTLTRK